MVTISYWLQKFSRHPDTFFNYFGGSRALISIPRKIGSLCKKLGIAKTCQRMSHDWFVLSVAWGAKGQLTFYQLRKYDQYFYFSTLGALKPCWFPLPALQIRLWLYKLYYTTYMKKYPVLCVWARSLIQKYCPAFIHFAFIVWTSFSEQVANMARLHAQNVVESFKFPGAVILKICRPTFEWTVCWM